MTPLSEYNDRNISNVQIMITWVNSLSLVVRCPLWRWTNSRPDEDKLQRRGDDKTKNKKKRDWRWHLVTRRITHRLGIGGAMEENAKLCSNVPTNMLRKMQSFKVFYIYLCEVHEVRGARGGAVGWGTTLQTGRSQVWFPMVLLNFFFLT